MRRATEFPIRLRALLGEGDQGISVSRLAWRLKRLARLDRNRCTPRRPPGTCPILANSIPKAGSNLLLQVLEGIPGACRAPVPFLFEGTAEQQPAQLRALGTVGRSQIAAGHIYYSPAYAEAIRRLGIRVVFVSRDPRDVLVSLAYFYLERLTDHPAHRVLRELPGQQERYRVLIRGIRTDGYVEPPFGAWVGRFLGWLDDPNTLAVTFEELVRSPESRDQAIRRIARWTLGDVDSTWLDRASRAMEANIDAARAWTFRAGRIGDWRREFDRETRALFEEMAGDLPARLGYPP